MAARDNEGLVHSLIIKGQRALLDRVGVRVDTPVVYLKAAWADPVLYGGRGHRLGCDIDVLVRRDRFKAFAHELANAGFARRVFPGWRFATAISKEWLFTSERGLSSVDLHRRLGEAPWFPEDSETYIARSVRYDSPDGPVLSLCPEDQVVYAAVHYAQSCFRLDGRHLEDMRRLVECRDIDWNEVWRTARAGQCDVPVVLLADALRAAGAVVPIDSGWLSGIGRLRLAVAEQFVETQHGLRRRRTLPRLLEYVTLMPAVSGRATAWPRFAGQFVVQRSLDRVDKMMGVRDVKHRSSNR